MAAAAQVLGRRRFRAETVDTLRILAKRRFSKHSEETWKEHRQEAQMAVLHNQLLAAERELLLSTRSHSKCMMLAKGAYHSLQRVVLHLLEIYISFGALEVTAGAVRLRITYDRRYLLGRGNVAFMVSFCDVDHPHDSRIHVHTFAHAEADETAAHLSVLMEEIGLDDAIAFLKEQRFPLSGGEAWFDVKMVFDWMSAVPTLGVAVPWTRTAADVVCAWCGCDKGWLQQGWRNGDPFAACELIDAPTALLTNLTTADCRYCPMHGCTRMLCGSLQSLRALAPHGTKGAFDECVGSVRKGWSQTTSLRCCEMELILKAPDTLRNLAALFPQQEIRLCRAAGGERVMALRTAVHMLLDSIRVFRGFVYTRRPTAADFSALAAARVCYLAFYYAQEWSIAPAPHYLLDHLLPLAKHDGTAFYAVQEGAEHKHSDDREDIKHTAQAGATGDRTGYQQMLDLQETRRILIGLGYGKRKFCPKHVEVGAAAPAALPIRPPLFAE